MRETEREREREREKERERETDRQTDRQRDRCPRRDIQDETPQGNRRTRKTNETRSRT